MSEKFNLNQNMNLKNIVISIAVIGSIITVSYVIITKTNQEKGLDNANNRPAIQVDETATELQKFSKLKEEIKNDRTKLYQDYKEELKLIDEAKDRAWGYSEPAFIEANQKVRKVDFENKKNTLAELEKVKCEILADTEKSKCEDLKTKLTNWINIYNEIYANGVDLKEGYNPIQRNKDRQLINVNRSIDGMVGFVIYNEKNPDMIDLTY